MTTLHELAAMLDAATEASREIDAVICEVFSLHPAGTERVMNTDGASDAWAGNAIWWEALPLTSSIDAALALVERLLPVSWIRTERLTLTRWQVRFEGGETVYWANAPTAPLAILKALVAALIAKENDHG